MKDYGSLSRHKWAIPLEIAMAAGAVVTFTQGNWKHFAISVFTFVVGFAPLWFERIVRVRLPALLQVTYVAFIFLSMFSGEVIGMYGRLWEWDDLVHLASGFLIGAAGVVGLAELSREHVRMPAWMQATFIFGLVASIVLLWEVAEFASDELFGTFSQGADLFDTMMDLIYGVSSGLIVALALVFHLKKRRIRLFDALIKTYAKLNR